MNTNVLRAVIRRNFVSYFASPTGYVFICLFVFFGAVAAFWVPAFFGNNLANLDQLTYWFPYIMLIYIPTITMGIWADERKQGTDELLLTIPARDFDIVLGKYLAAVGIFSVSLVFSLLCNYLVLNNLASANAWIDVVPRLDLGLFVSTYIGYWLVGLAMLAVGVIASFLTNNVTIAFVLGVLFNMPLVFLMWADTMFGSLGRQSVLAISRWSVAERMSDFARGVVTLTGAAYFAAILAVMLYLSMILIGRRHWFTGPRRWLLAGHYAVRTLALLAVAVGAVAMLQRHDQRLDISSEHLSSLSPDTYKLIENLKVDRPVQIEAFISPSVPETYVQTRLNLLSTLRELQALGGSKVQVEIHNTDRYSKEAALADKRYGIEPRQVTTFNQGAFSQEYIFLNVAMSCGVQKVPPVFIDRGIPIEYELVRSLATVSQQKRRTVGILSTDAKLYGNFSMQTMSSTPGWPIIDELEKQYEVVRVDPSKPITEKYDVLLAVQPSSLGPAEMDHFIAAVENGQPTAIFEDPAPMFSAGVPATSMPRQSPGGMNPMFGGMQSPPKGDISKLWRLLGVDFAADQVIWQDYNPYPKFSDFSRNKEFVFIGPACGAQPPFNPKDPISSGLQQLLFPFPGAVGQLNSTSPDLHFTPLVKTGERTGTVRYSELMQMSPFGPRGQLNPDRRLYPTGRSYDLAAHIEGKVKIDPQAEAPEKNGDKPAEKKADEKPRKANINVVLVADVDMISPIIFRLREQGEMPEAGIDFNFDNVTFVLNVLDELAGDNRFIEIRKRRPHHRTLARIEERTKAARQEATDEREKFVKEYDREEKREEQAIMDKLAELKKRKNVDIQQMAIEVSMMQDNLERERTAKLKQLSDEKDRNITKIETELKSKVDAVQLGYKLWAILLPPILPLMLAVMVFFIRRGREHEGVSRERLR